MRDNRTRTLWGRCLPVLAAIFAVAFTTPAHSQYSVTVFPYSGPAPKWITVTIDVYGSSVYGVRLDFDDGEVREWGDGSSVIDPFSEVINHEYTCPGDYRLVFWRHNGTRWVSIPYQIQISQPEQFLTNPVVNGGAVYVESSDHNASPERTLIDWGEGAAFEEFNWEEITPGVYTTPTHYYAAGGEYTIVVISQFIGPRCAMSQTTTLRVTVSNTTPVTRTTWGRIKALYR